MPISPLAGKPAPKEMLIDPARLEREYLRSPARSRGSEPAGQLRHQRPSRLAAARHVHRSAHPGHHPGDLRLPAARRASTARSTWARTRTRCPGRPSAPRWRCWRPTASRPSSSATTASRRRRSSRAPSSSTTAAAPTASPTASSSRRRTTRRRTAASSTTRPTAARPTPTSRSGSQDRANELLRDGNAGVKRVPLRRGHQGGDDAPGRSSSCPTSTTCATSSTWTRSAPPASSWRRPARRRRRALLGADQRDLRAGHHGRQPGGRSDLLVHDRRSRRQDPHGLLQPVRDGAAGRPQGPVSASPSPTIRTPTATASSRRRPG